MTVPTHNLYDFVHQTTKRQYWLMYFYPWGSRDLSKLIPYQVDDDFVNSVHGIPPENRFRIDGYDPGQYNLLTVRKTQPILICHDQEPLLFNRYLETTEFYKKILHANIPKNLHEFMSNNFSQFKITCTNYNDICILLHSEINSCEVKKYQNSGEFLLAYWWSHAAIARDWYRYAQFDAALDHYCPDKLFLVHCRDTSGTRKYRKDFLQLIKSHALSDHVQIGSRDNYNATANSSAEYHSIDLAHTGISVVLETVFDSRIHLTEKTMRPIACGHPFILAAGPGSLSTIRSYGFETFGSYIDESYDDIDDSTDRLKAIVTEMKRISKLTKMQQSTLLDNCKKIAIRNKNHFFSDSFFNQVKEELKNNVSNAHSKGNNELNLEKWKKIYDTCQRVTANKTLNRQHEQILFHLLKQRRYSSP